MKEITDFCQQIKDAGGQALLVGGAVRDSLLGLNPKDWDLEIYGLESEVIEKIAQQMGKVSEVGKAFGIIKLVIGEVELDISLPRTDSKIGQGHGGFAIKTNPFMSKIDAARRRDFTINSLAQDPLTGEIYDSFGGVTDLQNKILRVTDSKLFGDDPLRVLRGLQFVSRFGLIIESETKAIMESMVSALIELPKERILEEWKKLLLKSECPSLGLQAGLELGVWDKLYPDIIPPLKTTPQEPEWHPEGDVWIHTLMTVDKAASIIRRESEVDQFVIMMAAFCHDFGKPSTTTFERGRVRSLAHEEAGEAPTIKFLELLGIDNLSTQKIVRLVSNHLKPSIFYIEEQKGNTVRNGAIRRLALKLNPASLAELVLVAEADHTGRGPFATGWVTDYPAGTWILERAKTLQVLDNIPTSLIQGRDLIAAGLKPSKEFGLIIKLADQLRDEKEYIREQVLNLLSSSLEETIQTLKEEND